MSRVDEMRGDLIGIPIWDAIAEMSQDLRLIASCCHCRIVATDVVFVAFYRYNLIGQERPNGSRFIQRLRGINHIGHDHGLAISSSNKYNDSSSNMICN